MPKVIADGSNDLTPTMRHLLADVFEDLRRLEARISDIMKEIEALAAKDEKARRLMTIPGIGPLGRRRCSRPLATVSNLRSHATWQPGLGWFRSNILPEAKPRCLASASAEIATSAVY